jgi:hypothetical protein
MQWLDKTREALRNRKINLKGRFELSPQEAETVEGFIRATRQAVETLFSGPDGAKAQKLADAHIEGLGRTIERVYMGARRAERKGFADRAPLTLAELGEIRVEYQEHVDLILGLSNGLSAAAYDKASTTTPYWKAGDLGAQLTDERIMGELLEKGITMSEEEIREAFPRGIRLHFSVHNPSDPLEAVGRAAKHMAETLTDERIMGELLKKGITMSEEEIREAFPRGIRLHFAVRNISDPLEAVGRAAKHMAETLTDERIMGELLEKGITMSEEEIREAFPRGVRLHFAVRNISDPLEACVRYAKGEIVCGRQYLKRA